MILAGAASTRCAAPFFFSPASGETDKAGRDEPAGMRPRVAWPTLAGIYFVLWWTVLFAVLPFGVRSQEETGEIVPGSDPGAPSAPKLLVKGLWTTVVTTAIFLVFYAANAAGLIDLEQFGTLWGLFPR